MEGKMISMLRGFFYRTGVWIKDLGERMARVKVMRWFSGPIIKLGLAIKDSV
jgi:hypothetical protein